MERRPQPVLRGFRPADLPRLAEWLVQAGLRVPRNMSGESFARRLLEDDRIRVWTAEADSRPVGFVRLDLAPDRTAEITLLVDPRRRRVGIGRALLAHAVREARAQGVRRLIAVVSQSNPAGLAFFAECGFERSGVAMPGFEHLVRLVHRGDRQPPLEIVP